MAVNEKTIALVTGANQGIGLAVSRKLAGEKGYHVVMAGRKEEAIKAAVEQLQKEGLDVEPLVLDLCSDESINAAYNQFREKFDHLDVLVNNAGIARVRPPPENPRDLYNEIINTNVIGSMAITEKFLPLVANSTQVKRVVFVSSGAGSMGNWATPGSPTRMFKAPAYAVSKSAVNALCLQYAVSHEDDKSWKFNCCCPGYCATNLNRYSGTNPPEVGAEIVCELATIGMDGLTGKYLNSQGSIPW